ncbi:MAG: type II secretion system protein, partial [Phycisphaerales bacterium JB061]
MLVANLNRQLYSESMRSTGVARGAFSIIELVVVIGLVMVLLGVFLPVLGAAKSSAKQVRLASQIRQTATMVSAYCDEYDGVYPIADDRFWFWQNYNGNGPRPYETGRNWAYALVDAGFFTEE